MSKRLRTVLAAAFTLIGLAFGMTVIGYWLFWAPVVPSEPPQRVVKIPSGSSLHQIVDSLRISGIIDDARRFSWAAELRGDKGRLKAGMFRIPAGASNADILGILVSGKVAMQRITIPEGRTASFIADLLQRDLEVDSAKFMSLVRDSTIARKLGVDAPQLEGYLFPDTYQLTWGMIPEQVIRVLVDQFQQVFDDSMRQRAAEIGMTVHQIVTLASIIEGEAMVDEERSLISAVYHNRLKAGWLLQADPTIQYLIPGGPRRLLLDDLEIDSPYNTYKYTGLPPGPVNNPGLRSLQAALYPADVGYLYFVARGDGRHTFSRTMAEHLAAKRNLDRLRRELRRKQRSQEDGG